MATSDYNLPKLGGTLAMTKLKNMILQVDPDLKVELKNIRINGQLQGCSGFVTNPATQKIAYVSTDTNHGTSRNNALLRSAKHTRDYTGGQNRFSGYAELPQELVDLIS
jgi:hypothetical protein